MGYCTWAGMNKRNRIYHDTEWGIPVHDDHDADCPCCKAINETYPTVVKQRLLEK